MAATADRLVTPPRRNDLAGAFGDLGVFIPLAVALIVSNGLSPTAVLGCGGAFYVLVAAVYRMPVPVQPMKVVAAVALAEGLAVDVISAAALMLGAALLLLGFSGVLDRLARLVPLWLIRGVQFAVGLALVRVAYRLLASPPAAFDPTHTRWWSLPVAIAVGLLLLWRPLAVLIVVGVGTFVALLTAGLPGFSGPATVSFPSLSSSSFSDAFFLLVVAQLPLTVTSSCVATSDAMRAYYDSMARRVRPGLLAKTMGAANLVVGASGGMMMCHGSSGVSAQYAFGARTWRAPAIVGGLFVVLGVAFGSTIVATLAEFPLTLLAAMLVPPALLHLRLALALQPRARVAALGVGTAGFVVGVGQAVLVCGTLAIVVTAVQRWRWAGTRQDELSPRRGEQSAPAIRAHGSPRRPGRGIRVGHALAGERIDP